MRLRAIYGLFAMVLFFAIPLAAQIDFTARSKDRVTGALTAAGLEFSSISETQDFVVVSIVIQRSTEVRAEIDYGREEITVKSWSLQTGDLVSLSNSDRDALAKLAAASQLGRASRAVDALASTLNFLDSYPPDQKVDLSTVGTKKLSEKKYSSLCNKTGSQVTGTYTVGSQTLTETAQLGPCYNESNQCLGRCGAGCKGSPGDSIQRFTQECLNHDLCTRKTGHIFQECFDEFTAAADGFFFAPDCGTLQGSWADNFNYQWNLSQSTSVSGKVDTTMCLTWNVTGTHKGANIKLVATTTQNLPNCCHSFTYTGKASDCNSASGTWMNNDCSGSGTWTLVRQGGASHFSFTDNEGNPAAPGECH